jgi:hypothetical protein
MPRKSAIVSSLERKEEGILLEKKPGTHPRLRHASCHRRRPSMKRDCSGALARPYVSEPSKPDTRVALLDCLPRFPRRFIQLLRQLVRVFLHFLVAGGPLRGGPCTPGLHGWHNRKCLYMEHAWPIEL